jgi:hypothetical protein
LLHALPLLRTEIELVANLKNVDWSRIAIEFGSQRQAHPFARSKLVNLLLAQRLYRPLLHARVWTMLMLMLLRQCRRYQQREQGCNPGFHPVILHFR